MVILEGNAYWGFDHELTTSPGWLKNFRGMFSLTSPLHSHNGLIRLTTTHLEFVGDELLVIYLQSINEIYMGFDENYPASSVKNFGIFWQPLRLTFDDNRIIYLIIDYNGFTTSNQLWYDTFKSILK